MAFLPELEERTTQSNTSRNNILLSILVGILLLSAGYLFYNQYNQSKIQFKQNESNAEKIKEINTDLAKLRVDIQEDRTNLKQKDAKIEVLTKKLDVLRSQNDAQKNGDKLALVNLLSKQISQLKVDKEKIQNQLSQAIVSYESKIASFQKIIRQKDSLMTGQKNSIEELEGIIAQKQGEVKKLELTLRETGDILQSLDDPIHVTITNVKFYANGFDDIDEDLSDTRKKKDITEVGVFYSLSRELKSNEKIVAEIKRVIDNTMIGKKEFGASDLAEIQKQAKESGMDRPLSVRIQRGAFDVPMKVNFYIKAGNSNQKTYLIDSKFVLNTKAKQVF
jgi:chromosome segregation ATPase